MTATGTISVTLLDKEYQIACPPEQQEALFRAARSLDARLRAIRTSGGIIGLERIAIMAALNLSYELQTVNERSLDAQALDALSETLDNTLARFSR